VWRKSVRQTGVGLAADGNGNGAIDSGDYDLWRAHFGQMAGSGSLNNSSVPEPSAMLLTMLMATGMVGARLRRAAKESKELCETRHQSTGFGTAQSDLLKLIVQWFSLARAAGR
jgi:hypothetical protein